MTYNKPTLKALASVLDAVQEINFGKVLDPDVPTNPAAYEVDE